MRENNFISKKELDEFKNSKLILKKRKIEIVNEANSYTEEVRRSVNSNYGFEKLYSQGLSIKTPLNINYQKQALNSLRKGIEEYDKRRGWRGPITNKIKDSNWKNRIEKYKLDPTLSWHFAEIVELDNSKIRFKTLTKDTSILGTIQLNNLKWILQKTKTINDKFKVGDIIFVKKEKDNWSLKQYPKVNGGIVVLDPFTGNVKALVGGFNFKSSEFNE